MFNKQQKDAYQSLKAPVELKEKVLAIEPKRRATVLPFVKYASAIAACLALLIGAYMFTKTSPLGIVVNGHELENSIEFYDVSPASDMRATSMLSVPVEIDIEEKTSISVSYGDMIVDDKEPQTELKVSENVFIWWNVERIENMPKCEMTIQSKEETTLITLEFDNVEKTITTKRITK